MSEWWLDQLQYAGVVRGEPFKLYIYDGDGFHHGGQWFQREPRYPEEEITVTNAEARAIQALDEGREIRITDGADLLVFHAVEGKQVYPHDQSWREFWDSL